MAFATTTDLSNVLGREIDAEDAAALAALDTATAMVQATVGQTIEEVEDDEIVLDGSGTRVLLLPEFPVSEIEVETEDDGVLVDGEDYQWSADGYVRRINGTWPTDLRSITVTYTHGYAVIPAIVVSVTARLAARLLDTSITARQETIGSYSVTYNQGTFQADELILLDQYKRR
jgi:hypothetical protein